MAGGRRDDVGRGCASIGLSGLESLPPRTRDRDVRRFDPQGRT